jgi:acetyl esterase
MKPFVKAFALLALSATAAAAAGDLFVEPGTKKFVDELAAKGGPPLYTLTPEAARKVLRDIQAAPVKKVPARIEDKVFPVGPGGSVSVRIVRPERSTGTLPGVIYIHGGGWILGDKDTHDRLIREIASGAGVALVFVEYTPSPEAQFPIPVEQAYAATKYVSEHGPALGIDAARLAIVGDSVGGDMTAAVTLLAKERHGPKLVFQALLYPVTDANFETDSYNRRADGPWLTKAAMKWFWDAYLPDVDARKNPIAAPLNATREQLEGLPPALVITDGDVLCDEGEAYARKLAEAGVRVTSTRYNGTIHDFCMLNPIADSPAARGAIRQTIDALKQALTRSE